MKTNKVLMETSKYANGKEAYKGSVLSTYGSTLEISMSTRLNVSNAGTILCPADGDLATARKKLRRGQIGARKSSVEFHVGGSNLTQDIVVEANSLDSAAKLAQFYNNKELVSYLNQGIKYHDQGGKEYSLEQVLRARSKSAENNTKIRERIDALKQEYGFKKGAKMSSRLLEEIANEMQEYISVTGVDVVITFKMRHVLNTDGSYAICSDKKALSDMIDSANYNTQGSRLVSGKEVQTLIIPVQSIEHIRIVEEGLSNLILQYVETAVPGSSYQLISTESLRPDGIDFKSLQDKDSSVRGFNTR